jgi:hypothetical protein
VRKEKLAAEKSTDLAILCVLSLVSSDWWTHASDQQSASAMQSGLSWTSVQIKLWLLYLNSMLHVC